MVDLGNGSLRQLVVWTDEQAHGVDEQTDGIGGIEAESLVRDDGHLGHLFHEILGDEGDDGIGTDEDGHLFLGGTGCQQFADGILEPLEHLRLIILSRQKFDAHETLVSTLVRYLLHHVGVCSPQLTGLCLVDLLQRQVFEVGSLFEEGIIEGDDATLGTKVRVEATCIHLSVIKLTFDVVEQAPVTGTPTVDALFHIAYDEVLAALMTHRLVEEHTEVLPLYGGGVLELVDHHMFQLGTDLLKDERRVAVADEGMEQLLGVAQQEAVRILVQFMHLLFDAT